MYSRQCSDRYGSSASTAGVATWMSQSIIPRAGPALVSGGYAIGHVLYSAGRAQQGLLNQQLVLSRAIGRLAIAHHADKGHELALIHHLPRQAIWARVE